MKYCSICGQEITDPLNPSSICKDCEKLHVTIEQKPIRWKKEVED